ncbi:MAG TPA: NfeD family protein [Egibacteraceae bacterium]|nr:NfeD family protein [Egibacteraceae bacterium]
MIARPSPAKAPTAHVRRAGALLIAAGAAIGLLSSSAVAADVAPPAGRVEVLELSGILDRTAAGFLLETIEAAEDASSTVVVIQLDTPGGVGVSMDAITDAIAGSSVPVVAWVGPPGARAVGAGAFVAHAAHVLSMAPGAILGAAAPSDLTQAGGPEADERLLVRLAELRGRDLAFASAAVLQSAAIVVSAAPLDDDHALPAGVDPERAEILDGDELARRGSIDFAAATLPDVLRELDGRQVLMGSPDEQQRTQTLSIDPTAVEVRFHSPGLVRRILHTAANPVLAYLLVMAGALAIVFELFQPGFGVAGVTGGALLGLGLYGLAALPVSWLAFAVLLLGVILLAVDLALAGFGALTLAGAAALSVGSFWLFTGPAPVRAPIWLIALIVLASLVFFVVIMTTVLRAQTSPALTAGPDLIGQIGSVRSVLNPEGHVFVGGALWRARADDGAGRIRTGTAVRVTDLDDSGTLLVEQTEAKNLEESANR